MCILTAAACMFVASKALQILQYENLSSSSIRIIQSSVVAATILRKPSFLKPSNHPITVCYLLYYIVSMIAIERVPHHTFTRPIYQLLIHCMIIVYEYECLCIISFFYLAIQLERISYPIHIYRIQSVHSSVAECFMFNVRFAGVLFVTAICYAFNCIQLHLE